MKTFICKIIASLLLFLLPLGLVAQSPNRVDLSSYCPAVGNQGDIQSCTGWAVGYAAMTIEKVIKVNQKNKRIITHHAYSANFLYQSLHGGNCQKGVPLQAVLELAQNGGNCLAGQFDRLTNNCKITPSKGLKFKAQVNRIKRYQNILTNKTDALSKIQAVRLMLTNKKPVIVSMKVKANFYKVRKAAKFYWPQQGDQSPAGGHAMVVVGYDDQKMAFRLMNSFGSNWGDEGFIWIKYQAFQEMCRSAYVVYL